MLKPIQFLLSVVLLVSATASAEPTLDPIEIVRLASDRVSAASSLSFHVEQRFDVVLSDGAKVEYSGAMDLMATRSKGLYMDFGDDLSAKRVWYNGNTMTILDSLKNLYVTVNAVGTISDALTRLELDYGAIMPLAPRARASLMCSKPDCPLPITSTDRPAIGAALRMLRTTHPNGSTNDPSS